MDRKKKPRNAKSSQRSLLVSVTSQAHYRHKSPTPSKHHNDEKKNKKDKIKQSHSTPHRDGQGRGDHRKKSQPNQLDARRPASTRKYRHQSRHSLYESLHLSATTSVIQLTESNSIESLNHEITAIHHEGPAIHQTLHGSHGVNNSPLTDANEKRKQLNKLHNFVDYSIKTGLEGMEKSWKAMADYLPPASTRIDFDENPEKNRFQDMVCVDQSRVFLEGSGGSGAGYIHASWVPIGGKKKCIITQLPLVETAVDFWEMCLQNEVQGILLILTEFEFEKLAARAFLPDQGDFVHYENHLKVCCLKVVEVSKNWNLHLCSVKLREQQKYVHVHHYKDWQHGKKPGNLDEIWQIESTFRRYSSSPHVYMSLSGGGRAGTFGAFQLVHQHLHGPGETLNITKCVKMARNYRMHSVQSAVQYQFIHVALLNHILAMKDIERIIVDKGKLKKVQQIVKKFAEE